MLPAANDLTQQFPAQDTIPALMGEPSVGGGINQTPADQGVFGHPVQLMAPQQQEVFAPAPVQQPQGMIPPSIPQAGVRPGMPQMVSC